MLKDDLNKYIANPSPVRLTIILESFNKKATKKNIDSLKLLIEDYQADDKLEPVLGWLDPNAITKQVKPESAGKEELGPMNQDDFEIIVRRIYGDPENPESLGNRVLSGKVHKFSVASYYHPDTLLDKFARLANRPTQPLEYFPRGIGSGANEPVWEVVLFGMAKIDRLIRHE